jgi:hypothetical protein
MKHVQNLSIAYVSGRMTMNPRIQELAEQCTAEGLFNDDSGLYAARINVEKFAELIIRECMELVEDSSMDVIKEQYIDPHLGNVKLMSTIGGDEVIAKHFGIEQ